MTKLVNQRFKRIVAVGCIFTLTVGSLTGCKKEDKPAAEESSYVLYKDASKSVEERVTDLLGRMTIEQKVAQMIMPEKNVEGGGASQEDVKKLGIGAVLSGGGSAPTTGNTASDWSELINSYKQAASESELGIPLIYGIDSVHGNNNVYGATVFPHQIGLGATGNAELVQTIGGIVAQESIATGANYIFSPVLGIPENERWGRFYECFGEDVDLVTELGTAYIQGYQGVKDTDEFLSSSKVIASAKHYIGEGQTMNGANQGVVSMKADDWDDILHNKLIIPYKEAVEAGVQTVMVSYNSVNGNNCHENTYLIKDLLKGELGFDGIVISDYNGVGHCQGFEYKNQLANCVNAGVDMLMEPLNWRECYDTLIGLVNDGIVKEDRIDDAVTRILRVKFRAGLFEQEINGEEEQKYMSEFGSDEHRAVARQAVRESATLLKNDEVNGKSAIEALADAQNIAVLGSKSNDIGAQCGGWTISWTGSMGNITEGTTILEGFMEVAPDKQFNYGASVSTIPENTDGVVIVVGESPYSETQGDTSPSGLALKPSDVSLIEETRAAVGDDVPVVVILITGRPLTIKDQLEMMDGLICAWLPGTEGAGIADVIFGEYDFTGHTTVTWPKNGEDIVNKFTDDSVVLFPYGTGLTK